MLDIADLEYYCYSGVWNAGLFWREWVQCNDRRQYQKHQKTEKRCEENQVKIKQSRKMWMLTRMRSNIKQKALKRADEEPQEHIKNNPSNEVTLDLDDISQLQIPILPLSGLYIPADRPVFPCGTFTEIQSAEFCHSPVIIKREKPNSHREFSVLRKEIQILNQIHHPNILLLMGIVKMDLNVFVTIFEDANNGTLYHLLHQKKTPLSAKEIQKFLTQLCHAMMFLHERGWLHTAITSHSILITANSTLKLTGFEMARKLDEMQEKDSVTKYLRKQLFQWQSPEQLEGQTKISTESDIFSAGLISWEMCTNAEPWIGYTHDGLLMKYKLLNCAVESEGLHWPFINKNSESFLICMKQMLQINPRRRISCFLEVLSEIHKLQESLSTTNLVLDHDQPVHFNGALKRAHLLLQPQPQRAFLTSNKQSHQQDRDPYTGLKRVSNSWQKLNTRSPSSKSINIVNIHSFNTNGKDTNCTSKERKYGVNKTHIKHQVPLENTRDYYNNKIQNIDIKETQINRTVTNQSIPGDVVTAFDSTQIRGQKHITQSSHKILHTPETGHHVTRSVPIKPASHLNQRTINFKSNNTKSISKERNFQYENILCQRLQNGNISHDNKKWETVVHSKLHHKLHSGCSIKGTEEHETINAKPSETNISTDSKYLLLENNAHHKNKPDRNQRNNNDAHHQHYVDHKHSSERPYSEEGTCQLRQDLETFSSDTESKDNGFESTDSGIFTISREFDQNILQQMNSTEDLYIDDEFCLEMELDSHMQLLCLFDDSTCEFNENFIDDIQLDITEDKNII